MTCHNLEAFLCPHISSQDFSTPFVAILLFERLLTISFVIQQYNVICQLEMSLLQMYFSKEKYYFESYKFQKQPPESSYALLYI